TLGQRIVVLKDGVIQQIDTPMALYDRPANLFVAGFLGSPAMNVLRGTLQR
ncbi:sugar ABC transporter ATP-binding protein, partial [Escherichia coli]|nr:sugar ABC transporter ATP-binding protein [Escherichia coli]